MIDRGNGTRASKAVSARARREALLRKALLGSTALIGITLATPAMAQSINPAGGGTISGTGSYTDATATNGGVQVTNTDNAGITMSGVTINNITGDPNGIAYKQIAAGGQSAVLFTAGANALRSDQNGAALSLQAANGNVTWAIGQFDTASTTDLAATFGAYLIATGFINVVDFGTVSSLRNVTGIAGDTGIYASSNSSSVNLSLKAPTISGFVTGINALSTTGANVTTTGGSISTLAGGTGIRASATSNGGAVTISSGSAITTSGTGTGISATSNNATTSVTTTSGGTINGGKYGIQVNAALAGQSTTVTIGAAIGDTTRPTTAAVDFTSTGVVGGTNTVNVNANVSGGTGFYTIGSSYTNTDLIVNVAPAVTVTGQSTSTIRAGRNVTVVNNGTISAPGAGSTAIGNAQAPSLIDVTNSGTITGGSFAISALGGATVTNAGTISAANNVAIDTGRGGTITNNTGGTIAGGSNATNGWAIRFNSSTFSTGQTVSNNATITGGAAGAIRLDAVTASTLNLNAGSTTTGLVKVSGTGATTTNLAGNLNGDYDASGASGTQNFTLAATGSAHNVTLGSGNDVFTWGGGAFTGTIDGGTGADTFQVDVGASTVKTLNLATDFANIINFDAFTLLSGRLTLTGSRDGGAGWAVAGGNATELTVNGALTNIAGNAVTLLTADQMFVLSGAQLSATGDVIYSTAIGNNISNAGTITAGTGMSSGIAIGSGTITNGGTITYAAGGSIATQGNGVLGISNQLTVTNNAGASIIGRWDGVRANNGIFASNYGLIRGDRFAGMEINGGSTITNYGTGRIYGATGEGAGILINSGVAGITNASGGQIVGAGIAAIYNGGTGLLTVSNSGTIATGTLDGTNNYVAGGIATAIRSGSAYVTNSGAIEGASGGILTTGALTLYNTGTINGFGTGLLSNDAVNAGGVATIVNSGSIAQGSGAAIHAGAGGTITNATGGALIGGNDATTGAAVQLIAGGTFNNYGAATSTAGIGVINGNTAATINLFAGSSIGKVISGSGNDTLAIYNGGSASDAAITDGTSGITLRNAGALTTAIYGAIDLGGGNDTIQLRGTGTGAQAGTFSLANATGVETISKLDSGTWTINGTATAPGISVIAGNGGPSGTLILSGTSGIGSLYVNGANVQANGGGAISGATVHMLAGNLQLAFASVYANNILLDVGTPLNGQASVFENLFGGNATLSGNITSGSGTNIGGQAIASSQALTFAGLANSVFNLTGTNSWTGITTINSGVTLQGSTNSISGGSIVDNGTLTYSQGTSGTIAQAISGTGALVVTAGGAVITLTGANTFTGGTTLSGSGANLVLGAGGQLAGNVVANANATLTFNRGDGYTFATSASGAGAVTALGTATLSGAFTNTGAFTVNSTTNGVVTLTGSRSGATGSGVVYTGMSSTFRVGSGGTVAGGDYLGVRMNGSNGTLANLGTITNAGTLYDNNWGAAVGVGATSGTTTVNNGDAGNSLATISGQNAGISHLGSGGVIATGLLTVNNYGTISSAIKNGIDNQAGSGALTVNNYAGGYIVGQGSGGAGAGVGNSNSSKLLTITNGGWIVGRTSGVSAFGSLNLTNSGTIASGTLSGGTSGTLTTGTGAGVIALNAAGSAITNQANGLITGNVGISASGNGLQLVNQNGAVIRGATSGISANGTITIDNSGTIETLSGAAGYGIRAGTGSTITNNLGGIIRQAGTGGMYTISASDTLTLVNAGTISNASTALFTAAVDATQTLTLTNSGTITAAGGAAVQLNGGDNVIANSGTITGGSDANFGFGVYATADSWNTTITNQAGGVIGGSRGGVRVDSADGIAIDNAGTLVGTAAISSGVFILNGDPTLTNRAGGTIVGQSWGIQSDDTGTITNAGFIGSGTLSGGTTGSFTVNAGGNAIAMSGGSVTNDATGSIVGGNYGITADGPMTIVNSGLISGGSHAIYLTGTGNNIVTLNAGSTTTGAIQLGDGGDTLNWNGGSFTSINGGAGHDVFNANLGAGSTTLNVATLSGFETYNQNGGALTLAGIQGAGGGWTVNGGALTLGANAKVDVTGTGVTLADGGTSITIINGGALIGNAGNGVVATADTSVTNGGMIRSHGTSYAGVTTDGGTIHNQAAGLIAADGTGVVMQAGGTTLSNAGIILGKVDGVVGGDVSQTLVNTNIIAVGDAGNNVTQFWQVNQNYSTGDGVRFTAGGSVTNSGIIAGGANGVAISGGAATIENSSSMIGYSGYGLLLDAAAGTTSTIVNHMSGSMEGGQGAVLLTGDGTVNLTNEIGSYMYGSIVSTGGGARNIDLSGTVYGDYDASASTGANTVTFRSGAHINNVTLGSGDDTFIYFGGIIDGVVDGGGGHDSLFADFGVGTSYNVSLANFIGFESLGLISGDMTLTGPSNNPGQAIYAGLGGVPSGTITFDGTSDLTGDIYVNGGAIRAATAGAFGSGTIHMIDPTATFGATGTYANNISLEVAAPSSANPSTLNTDAGVIATLTGAITTGTGAGVDPNQDLVFGGTGTVILTNAGNSWTGTTTINHGATLQGSAAAISGSAIVNNGELVYDEAGNSIVVANITGSGNFHKIGSGSLTLTGTNSWTGNTEIGGGWLIGTTDSISGSTLNFNGGNLAFVQAANGTFAADMSGSGYVNVWAGGNTLTFSGHNAFTGSINVQDASTVAITGTLNTGTANSINLYNAGAGVTNSGTISGARAVEGGVAGVLVNNLAGGTITGNAQSAVMLWQGGTVTNAGTINNGNGQATIYMAGANGSVTNSANAIIQNSVGNALNINSANFTLDNAGTIQGIHTAVAINSGTSASVTNSGLISGANYGIRAATAGATIVNSGSGTITATGGPAAIAVFLTGDNASVTNQAGASITGAGYGVFISGTNGAVTNNGAIIVNAGTGASLSNGGVITNAGAISAGTTGSGIGLGVYAGGAATVTNQSGGTISGGNLAMLLAGSDLVTVNLNAGSTTTGLIASAGNGARAINIFGKLDGNYEGSDGADLITLDTGATLTGWLDGGAGNDTLALVGSGSATLGTVRNIESATKSGTGTWTIATPTGIGAWTITDGTLVLAGGNAIADTASVAVNGGTVRLAASEAIGSLSGTGIVALGANTLGLTSGGSTFTGTLTGTTGNLLIDGANFTFGGTAGYGGLTEVRSGGLTLAAGASFNPASTLLVGTAGTLNLANVGMTVSQAKLQGVLNGSGTLTASIIELDGATVNANLAGPVTNSGGISTLNGMVVGANVAVTGGTLRLGAGERIADTANLSVAQGATFDLQGFNETVALASLAGTLAGTGTLTASEYDLAGATVNANLGAGTVYSTGASKLNGTAAGNVAVNGGTLTLGASNRLADTATVAVASGATLDIGAFSDTIGTLGLGGTLAGTGTLTAGQYQLTGATVNANLGAGTLFNLGGTSVLNGTAASDVSVQAGTLTLGAANRIADTATLNVGTGATFNLGNFNETVGLAGIAGTLAGTGTLTAGQYQLTGATVNANLGNGTLFNLGGTSVLNGTAAGNVAVQAGTLALGASNRLADTATVAVASGATLDIGAFSDTIGTIGLGGTLAGTGTLTAGQYQLTGATVNANLGNGTLFNLGGTSVLNGTAAGDVSVQAGTLTLGAANRIADTATLNVGTGATFNLGNFNETVGLAGIAGTLAGTGTLTAGQYQLTGATVNANLGNGALFNLGGTSVLNGTAAATNVTVQAGTLRLGASDRLADSATLGVASGATFDLAGYNETVASLAGSGTVALGTGRLTLSSAANTAFGGAITGSGTIDKQGIGTLTLAGTFATTGRFDVSAGTLAFSGSTQGGIRVQGGTLTGGGTLAGPLTIASGTFSPGGLAGAPGAINPIGNFTVGSLVVSGGTLLFDFGGTGFNFASDSIKVNGAATLTGGTVQVNALTSAASDYRFNQLYTIVQANTLTGTFANGSVFATVASNPNLKWRLRYDLLANAVVLQVQKNMEFNDGIAAGDRNTLAVANALGSSTTGNASDQWSATLNTITSLDTQQRVAAFRSLSGEILANASSATISANNQFTDLLRQRVGDGSDALIGGGFAGSSLADVRTTATAGNGFASSLAGASLPGAGDGEAGNGGIWGQVYGGYQKLVGDGVHAGVDNTVAGVAMGLETRTGGLTAGIAGGVAQIDSDMNSRSATMSGNQYQLGGYLSYDAGSLFVAASGSWYSSDLNSRRTLALGTTTALATGDIHATGYSVGVSGGFRTELGNGLRLALIGSANKVRNQQDGFAESAAGGLGLQMASANRDLFTAGAELRLGAKVKTGAGVAMPWVSMGVRYNSGDLDTVGALRFSGAPSGTGGFGIEGVRMAPVLGTLGVGIDARASRNVRLGIALEGSAGENTREGRASVRVKIGF